MGVQSMYDISVPIKNLFYTEDNTITINSFMTGLIDSGIIGIFVYALFYLPYALIYHTGEINMFILGFSLIGIGSWVSLIAIIRYFYGDKILFRGR
jgi:hypothetical protein